MLIESVWAIVSQMRAIGGAKTGQVAAVLGLVRAV